MTLARLGLAAVLGLGCGVEDSDASSQERVLYGDDDRVESNQAPSSALRAAARSVALQVDRSELRCDADGTRCDLRTHDVSEALGAPWCDYEPFADQTLAGRCSAFLVGEDLLVTAGHCIDEDRCPTSSFVFDYAVGRDGAADTTGLTTYHCEDVVYHAYSNDEDIALVRVDRPVTRTPLCIEREEHPDDGTPLASIGHMAGLPKKTSDGGEATGADGDERFGHTVDTIGGSSGAPIFDRRTLQVVGSHSTSPQDAFEWDAFYGCLYWSRCAEDGCDGRVATASSTRTIADLVPQTACFSGRSAHQNPGDRYDVNDDGRVSATDRDLVVGALAQHGAGPGRFSLHEQAPRPPYLDVDGDGWLGDADRVLIGAKLGAPNVAEGSCGDFDGDGVAITPTDFVAAFQRYEGEAATHAVDGDCDDDRRITSADFVAAYARGLPYVY